MAKTLVTMSSVSNDVKAGAVARHVGPSSDDEASSPVPHDNFLDPAIWKDPYPYFAALRENDPVHWSEWWNGWVITGYRDVESLLRRGATISAATAAAAIARASEEDLQRRSASFRILSHWLALIDPPDHTRLRRLVNKAFTPTRVSALRTGIEQRAAELLDTASQRGECDAVQDFAHPLTLTVISDMLGIPEPDRAELGGWADLIFPLALDSRGHEDRKQVAETVLQAMETYFRRLIRKRRDEPGDDLLSALVAAEHEGGILTEDEVIATAVLLIFAGQETTTGLIANALLALAMHRDQLEILRRQPDLIPAAVEEILRYCGSAFAITRVATGEIHMRGKVLSPGDKLLLVIGAANRDPEQFASPDHLLVTREDTGSLALGGGAHYCLGGPLARAECEIALRQIIGRFPDYEVSSGDLCWKPAVIVREPESLRIRLHGSQHRSSPWS